MICRSCGYVFLAQEAAMSRMDLHFLRRPDPQLSICLMCPRCQRLDFCRNDYRMPEPRLHVYEPNDPRS